MRLSFGTICAFTLFTTTAQAGCFGSGTSLFHCTMSNGKNAVDVCLQEGVVTYSFGKLGKTPDLLLARKEVDVSMSPWNGVGRSIYEEISFHNREYSYILGYSMDRKAQDSPLEGTLIVVEGDATAAELTCDKGSVQTADFYPLFEAKELAGQRYCPDAFLWANNC